MPSLLLAGCLRIESPLEGHEPLGKRGAGGPIRGECRCVIGLGAHPHAVAVAGARQIGQCSDERGADPTVAMVRIDGQLIQEHLGAFVRVACLHSADEANRIAALVITGGQNEMLVACARRAILITATR
jgi:hypothetical protein